MWLVMSLAALALACSSASGDKGESTQGSDTGNVAVDSDSPTAKAATKPETNDDEPAAEATKKLTVAQQNAVEKAADYLSYSSFSRSGLVKQLKFEGFSTKDATFGVDAQNANWNDQAAK